MSRLDELSAQLEAVEARSRKTIERYEALRAEIAESQRAEEADESAAYDDLVYEVDKLNNRVLDLLSENGCLRQKLAAMREVVQAVLTTTDEAGDWVRCAFCGFHCGRHADDCKREPARQLLSIKDNDNDK